MCACETSISRTKKAPFEVVSVHISVPDLPACFENYCMVQLSDFHHGPITSAKHLENALNIAKAEKPDIILLTGDYIQHSTVGLKYVVRRRLKDTLYRRREYREPVIQWSKNLGALLETMTPIDGIVGVFGNHDHFEGVGTIRRMLPRNISWLRNSSSFVTREDSAIFIGGIEDNRKGMPKIEKALSALKHAQYKPFFKVLLSHNPDSVALKDRKLLKSIDLILCGHTHGGQIQFPLLGPILTRTRQRKHIKGLSQLENSLVYVNRGLGFGTLPIRLFCAPEITVFRLKGQNFKVRARDCGFQPGVDISHLNIIADKVDDK